MFSSIQAFIGRHKRKFIFGSVFIGGAFLLSNYVNKLLKEHHERETKELLERNKKQQHFESVEGLCRDTALSMSPSLKNTIIKELNTGVLINKLKDKTSDKIVCWEKLKILSFARVVAFIYATSMVTVTLRIQFNLIGGYIFRDVTDAKKQFTSDIQEKYLNFCSYFTNTGVVKLCKLVEEKVSIMLKNKSLKAEMTLQDVENVISAVQALIAVDSKNPCQAMTEYFLPEEYGKDSFATHNKYFDQLIKDTKDLFESNEISSSLSFCVEHCKMIFMETLTEYFRGKGKKNSKNTLNECPKSAGTSKDAINTLGFLNRDEEYFDCSKITIQMAKIIPILNGLTQNNKNDLPHKWMSHLIMMDCLQTMGANIYETFSSKYSDI